MNWRERRAQRRLRKSWGRTWSIILVLIITTLFVVLGIKVEEYFTNLKLLGWAESTYSVQAKTLTVMAEENKQFKENPDTRVEQLRVYLEGKKSPLTPYAQLIVWEANKNDIPWTLIVAISGKESSFGHALPPGSHNAWGIMAWDKAGVRSVRRFASWEEGIKFTSQLLGENYRENMNRGIQVKYCPDFECSDTWVQHVTQFQEQINKYDQV